METKKRLDLVDREAVKDAIGFMNLHFLGHGETKSVLDSINEVPAVDAVEVVHGRWVLTAHEERTNFRWNVTAECSECQHSKGEIYAGCFTGFPKALVEECIIMYAEKIKLDNYCPNCGAKMDGDGNG